METLGKISLMSIQKSNPSRYNDKFSSTVKTIQPAECTYSNTRSVRAFNLELHKKYLHRPRQHIVSVTCPISK